ncbi:MAG TPA: ankyrin repeat domain-containing protein [Steroidobacteraceae bacterium]|nr:ankyrin repeat domain-containing protein [Steroidobacteraceae bacterium]
MRIRNILLPLLAALLPLGAAAAALPDLVQANEHAAAMQAIRSGADVDAVQADGTSALLWAVYRIDHEVARALLDRGADPDARNSLGTSPLCEAAAISDEKLVAMLLKAGADPNLGNNDGQTPLMIAARNGALPIVQLLVKAGARVNEREQYRGQTALMWAVAASSVEVVDFLLRHKARVDARATVNDWGNQITSEPRAQYRPAGGLTALLYATRSGCLDCARLLLKAGADINRPTPEGVTPLMNAIDNNSYEIANFLLDQGANPHISDWWGRTALYLAADMRTRGTARGAPAEFRSAEGLAPRQPQSAALQLAQRLLALGVDPNTQLNMHRPFRGRFSDDLMTTGCSPLLRAALSVDREMVELLLKHGALPDLPNVMGVTPLMAAAGVGATRGAVVGQGPVAGSDPEANAVAVIGLLLKAGADVNARISDTSSRTAVIARPSSMTDRQGQTALYGAIGQNWTRVARLLIDSGARLDVKDAAGKTPLDALAARAGGRDTPSNEQMVQLIRAASGG